LHPTQKPVMALEPLIRAYSAPDALVFDPFAGSGPTLVAAQKLGRRCLGIEMVREYAASAAARLDRALHAFTHPTAYELYGGS
jgi:site-specific DNA-methyltransferase (adenine-specific)